jgi:hypothetical protein
MSSSGFSPSLVIDHPRCRRVQALILCATLLAAAALGHGGLTGWLHALALLLVGGGGLRELRRASPRAPRYVARILVTADGRFLLGLARDPDTLLPVIVVHHWTLPGIAVGLAFAGAQMERAEVILFRDRVPRDAWRHLAVRLRHAVCTGS